MFAGVARALGATPTEQSPLVTSGVRGMEMLWSEPSSTAVLVGTNESGAAVVGVKCGGGGGEGVARDASDVR